VTELPLRKNHFLAYVLLGHYLDEDHLPVYLRRENFNVIRQRLDRIEILTGSCEHYFSTLPAESITKFNYSNIFEWMDPKAFENLLKETIRIAGNGSVITYRNLLVPRSRPESLDPWIRPQKELSEQLHNEDLSFIYRAYVVEHIIKRS
jgi:S-adenosylmethionine-diacylglycerol 3-amino-3-carboxypropyl transferase